MTRRSVITERQRALYEALRTAATDVSNECDAPICTDAHAALSRLTDTLDDLDAYCERCDDTGTVEEVRNAGSSTCDPADVDEVPCGDCEASRVLAEKRANEQRRDEHSGVARG